MEVKMDSGPSNDDGIDRDSMFYSRMCESLQVVPLLEVDFLHENLRRMVTEYISHEKCDPRKLALLGGQRITLYFLQNPKVQLGSCWQFGCLSPDDGWGLSMEGRVDQQYHVKDYKSCLEFLGRKNPPRCPIVIEVLVFQLNVSSQDSLSALDDVERTLEMLQEHLKNVQYVVFAIEEGVFCCFSVKDVIEKANGLPRTVNRPLALKQILVDFRTWQHANDRLNTKLLLDHYIFNDDKPMSYMYLSRFVISLKHSHNRDLFDMVDPTLKSSKLLCIHDLESPDDAAHLSFKTTQRCHALYLDANMYGGWSSFPQSSQPIFCLEENLSIERLVIDAHIFGYPVLLPRLHVPLTGTTPFSALIELTLKGFDIVLSLTDLNNGLFPNLTHLCVKYGTITGQLDSHHVPRLKTLILELKISYDESHSAVIPLINERCQSLINARRPWQLVATDKTGGWSLASYEEPTTRHEIEMKADSSLSSPPAQPFIKELMLVANSHENVDEYQSQLKGDPFQKAVAEDCSERRLVWAPQRVQSITLFSTVGRGEVQFEFKEAIPGGTRALTSLASYDVTLTLDGDVLPDLQKLNLNFSSMKLSGTFHRLQALSFEEGILLSEWQVNAPLLQSLHCRKLARGGNLLLPPQQLPHLSSLQIKPMRYDPSYFPKILVDEDGIGLSGVEYVLFGKRMLSYCFDQCQLNRVLHLELTVDAYQLPKYWHNTDWLCETLTITVDALASRFQHQNQAHIAVVLPPLPQVKTLTVTKHSCDVLLNSEMPKLAYCKVPCPMSLGPKLKCPALQQICFTDKVLYWHKKIICLSRPTYEAIGAQPREIIFSSEYQSHTMEWNVGPSEKETLS